jgi:hypothetical protein
MNEDLMDETCWDVQPETSIGEITEWCLVHRDVNRVFVVARPDQANPGKLTEPRVEKAVEKIFGKKVLRALWAAAWAGTKLFRKRSAKIWIIEFDGEVRDRMMAAESSLAGWVHAKERPLPEDVCLYRSGDPLPTFVSVTHEPEAWLFDASADGARFVERAERPLPADLIPAPPDFVTPG